MQESFCLHQNCMREEINLRINEPYCHNHQQERNLIDWQQLFLLAGGCGGEVVAPLSNSNLPDGVFFCLLV